MDSSKIKGSVPMFTVTKVNNESKDLVSAPETSPTFAVSPSTLPPCVEETVGETNEPGESPDPPVVPQNSKFRPVLRKNASRTSSRYPHFHSGLKRIRQSLDLAPEERPLSENDDRSIGMNDVITPSPSLKSLHRTSSVKSLSRLSRASQSDLNETVKSGSTGIISLKQLREVAKRGRLFAKRKTFRLVHQTGECNIQFVNVDKRGARFLLDIFTTLVALKWRYNIFVYLVSFLLSWMLFALVWWGLSILYGVDTDGTPCVEGVDDFTSAFLFSIETQHTIGYGSRHITTRCPPAVCLLILQSVIGAVMQCIVTGIVFAKLSRPNQRAETVMFSRKAVICPDSDGTPCLVFRVGDMRRSQLIGVSINTVFVNKSFNIELKTIQLEQKSLRTTTEANRHQNEDQSSFYFLAWPIKIIHRIDEHSPLYNLSPNDLLVSNFEIVVVLEATCEATGATIQVRTSYLPSEILWGHILVSLMTYQKDNGRFKIDYSQFHEVKPVYVPDMSACAMSKNKNKSKRLPIDSVELVDETKNNYCIKSTFYNYTNDDNNNKNNGNEKPALLQCFENA